MGVGQRVREEEMLSVERKGGKCCLLRGMEGTALRGREETAIC